MSSYINVIGSYNPNVQTYGKVFFNDNSKLAFQYINGCGLLVVNLSNPSIPYTFYLQQFLGNGQTLGGLSVSPNFNYAVCVSEVNNYYSVLFDISNPSNIIYKKFYYSNDGNGTSPCFIDNDRFLLCDISGDSKLYLYNTNLVLLSVKKFNTPTYYNFIAKSLIGTDNNGNVYLFGVETLIGKYAVYKAYIDNNGIVLSRIFNFQSLNSTNDCCITPDGKKICVNINDFTNKIGYLYIYNIDGDQLFYSNNFYAKATSTLCDKYMGVNNQLNSIFLFPYNAGVRLFNKDGIIYSNNLPTNGITLTNDGYFFASGPLFYYGLYYNPPIVNQEIGDNVSVSDIGAINLLNYGRPVSILGKYKS